MNESVEIEGDKDDRRLIDALMLMVLSSSLLNGFVLCLSLKGDR